MPIPSSLIVNSIFLPLRLQSIKIVEPRIFNPNDNSIINISCISCTVLGLDVEFSFENINTGNIEWIPDWNIGNDLNTSALSNLETGLYFMRMSIIENDTSSINIERTINLDTVNPMVYSDIYSDDYSINPLPGTNPSNGGHDITKYDNIRFSVIEGPTYFGDSYVTHSSTDKQSPYDLSYIFNNKLEISFDVSLNGESLILPNNLQNQINIDDDFSFAYHFNNQDWLNIDNESFGTLVYIIDILDNAGNYTQQIFEYELQSSNAISLMNFFNYPNPFSTKDGEYTSFRYSLLEPLNSGQLIIYDISGKTLYNFPDKSVTNILESGRNTIPHGISKPSEKGSTFNLAYFVSRI